MTVINNFKDNVAYGNDIISVKIFFLKIALYVIHPLTPIFNISLEHDIFSDKLKIAIIKSLHKSGGYREYGKYSVLGPIMFIMYINSLYDMNINGQIIMYTKDTCLLLSGTNWENRIQL